MLAGATQAQSRVGQRLPEQVSVAGPRIGTYATLRMAYKQDPLLSRKTFADIIEEALDIAAGNFNSSNGG